MPGKVRYVTIKDDAATELNFSSFYTTKDGRLLCVNGNKIEKVVLAGDWFVLQREDKSLLARRNQSFMQPRKLSPELQLIVRAPELVRTEVIKKLWAFIRKNGLQDSRNRRLIHVSKTPETALLFKGKKTINMFEMTKLLDKHIS